MCPYYHCMRTLPLYAYAPAAGPKQDHPAASLKGEQHHGSYTKYTRYTKDALQKHKTGRLPLQRTRTAPVRRLLHRNPASPQTLRNACKTRLRDHDPLLIAPDLLRATSSPSWIDQIWDAPLEVRTFSILTHPASLCILYPPFANAEGKRSGRNRLTGTVGASFILQAVVEAWSASHSDRRSGGEGALRKCVSKRMA